MPRISGTVTGLDPDTTYEFQVRVVNADGTPGDWSNVATGTTLPASGNLLYFNGMMYSETIFTENNYVEFQFVATIDGLATYTFDRSVSPQEVMYSGRRIARDDHDNTGVGSLSNPSDPGQIATGEWIVIDLEQLRLAYPAFSTLSVEVKAIGTYHTGMALPNPDVGARGHIASGAAIYYEDVAPPDPPTWFPYQLLPEGDPFHDPGMEVVQSEVVNTAGSSVATFDMGELGGGGFSWPAMVASMTTLATYSYDDSTRTLTVL